jgi:hypothetical protein
MRWWGRWPLGSDEFSQRRVELESWRGVFLSVGSVENEFAVGVACDGPAVFVEEPVMKPA